MHEKARHELIEAIQQQLAALADGSHTGPAYGQVRKIAENVTTLVAWTPDDRERKS